MSTVYVLEPPTAGKVVISTTLGDLDVELWPREAPKAVRNFVQLCLEGYYDGTIFHRVIPGFMVQGGDPTASGTGGESIYGEPFKDEFHSRLRFTHRGIVACAGGAEGQPNNNGSQFFFTLDRCDWLDKKHTIFGKVTGDTIFNLVKFNDVDVGDDDRPVDPPRIIRTEVIWNPFDDIEPRTLPSTSRHHDGAAEAEGKQADSARARAGRRGGGGRAARLQAPQQVQAGSSTKKLNLLSFGEEAEEEEAELAAATAEAATIDGDVGGSRIRSSHDVLEDPRLLAQPASDVRQRMASGAAAAPAAAAGRRGAAAGEQREAGRRSDSSDNGRVSHDIDDNDNDEDSCGRRDTAREREGGRRAAGEGGGGGGSHGSGKIAEDAGGSVKRVDQIRRALAGPQRGKVGEGGGEGKDRPPLVDGSDGGGGSEEDGDDFDAVMRRKVRERERQRRLLQKKDQGNWKAQGHSSDRQDASISGSHDEGAAAGRLPSQERARDKGAVEAASDRDSSDDGGGSDDGDASGGRRSASPKPNVSKLRLRKAAAAAARTKGQQEPESLATAAEQQQQRLRLHRKSVAPREQHTLEKLAKFQARLKGGGRSMAAASASAPQDAAAATRAVGGDSVRARADAGGAGGLEGRRQRRRRGDDIDDDEDDDGGDVDGWMRHRLQFALDAGSKQRREMERNDDPNQYVVHDPLLEKGKEKFNRMIAKAKKRGREWVGKSLD